MICDANTSLLQEPESYRRHCCVGLSTKSLPGIGIKIQQSVYFTRATRCWILSQPSTQLIRTLKPATKVTIIATVCLCSLLVTTFRINYVIADEPRRSKLASASIIQDGQAEVPPLPTSPSEEVTADTIASYHPANGPNIDGVVSLLMGSQRHVDVYLLELPDGAYTHSSYQTP